MSDDIVVANSESMAGTRFAPASALALAEIGRISTIVKTWHKSVFYWIGLAVLLDRAATVFVSEAFPMGAFVRTAMLTLASVNDSFAPHPIAMEFFNWDAKSAARVIRPALLRADSPRMARLFTVEQVVRVYKLVRSEFAPLQSDSARHVAVFDAIVPFIGLAVPLLGEQLIFDQPNVIESLRFSFILQLPHVRRDLNAHQALMLCEDAKDLDVAFKKIRANEPKVNDNKEKNDNVADDNAVPPQQARTRSRTRSRSHVCEIHGRCTHTTDTCVSKIGNNSKGNEGNEDGDSDSDGEDDDDDEE